MFDLAWSELALIAVVALVVIGPKDLPEAVRGVAKGVQKLRRMAGEFQGHVDEMVREAKLDEVRNQINEIRNFDLKGEIERAVDKDGTIRTTFQDNPATPSYPPAGTTASAADPLAPAPAPVGTPATAEPPPAAEAAAQPAFLPPDAPAFLPPAPALAEAPAAAPAEPPPPAPRAPEAAPARAPEAPAFLPPAPARPPAEATAGTAAAPKT
jgi:sec-independent protein translocase protein TatB